MTAPAVPGREGPWYGRPRVMVPLILGVLLALALLTPDKANTDMGSDVLTTRETTPLAAGLARELPAALGWRVGENTSSGVPAGTDVIHAVLAPDTPMRGKEVHELLERVRAGAGLLVVINRESGLLADSLRLQVGQPGTLVPLDDLAAHCAPATVPALPWLRQQPRYAAVRFRGPPPVAVDTLLAAETDQGRRPLYAGFALGAGRVVAAADADLLRTDQLRQCDPGLGPPYVRVLEYLRDSTAGPRRTRLLFDEYHQGHGAQPGTIRAVATYLGETASGHVVAQLALAGLLLVLARMPRLVPPPPDVTDERRSPIEHVDALARAYLQVGATRTAAQRLVRGLRRRTERAGARGATSLDDAAWLARVATRHPPLAPRVALVGAALERGHPARTFTEVGEAIAAIETTLRELA